MGHSSFAYLIGLVLNIPGVEQGGVLGSGNHLLYLVQDKGHERGHLGPCSIRQLLRTKAVNPYPLCNPQACCMLCIAAKCASDCCKTPKPPQQQTAQWEFLSLKSLGSLCVSLMNGAVMKEAAVWELYIYPYTIDIACTVWHALPHRTVPTQHTVCRTRELFSREPMRPTQ